MDTVTNKFSVRKGILIFMTAFKSHIEYLIITFVSIYFQLCVPKYVKDIRLECRVQMAKLLNVAREDYNDYHLVADSLGFPAPVIDVMGETENPTISLLRKCNTFSGQFLIETLYARGRFDVMRVILLYYKGVIFNLL